MNRHGSDGPTALVEVDGRMKIVDIVEFGPDVTELEDQQNVWNDVIGRVGPTMKPFVDAGSVTEPGVAPHADLSRNSRRGVKPSRQADRGTSGGVSNATQHQGGGPSRNRGTGDR